MTCPYFILFFYKHIVPSGLRRCYFTSQITHISLKLIHIGHDLSLYLIFPQTYSPFGLRNVILNLKLPIYLLKDADYVIDVWGYRER